MNDRGKLGNFLTEVIHWDWRQFCEAEKDPKYTGLQATVLALVRTTAEGKLGAIKLAIDRVDGKIETPIKVEYPKVWFVYPEAKGLAKSDPDLAIGAGSEMAVAEEITEEVEEEPANVATMTLRQTLNKMADSPRQVVPLVLLEKQSVENGAPTIGDEPPLVKSVIAANLIHLAIEKNNFEAITEIFDQIDGKLVETIKVLGDDIYLTQYSLEAPAGSVKNKEGIYMIEAKEIANTWRQKLESKKR